MVLHTKQRSIEKKEGERETIETHLEVFRQILREDTNSTEGRDRESKIHINTQVLNKR